ncbi:MAG: hypothetical protein H0W69_05745 [Gemmatimonadaceae bacterium]|nr:hypothetical protein [Gemmatimonadaceae bacterium]
MSKRNKTLETLRGLLAERQQFEQWLAALALKRPDTPGQVYMRVHQDYQSRLDGVLDRLQSHTEDLQGSMSELGTQLAEVTARENSRREAQQEAELRAAVGEYSADQWTQMSREGETEITKLSQERSGIESQLAELSGILELTQGRMQMADSLIQPPNTYAEGRTIAEPPAPIEVPPKVYAPPEIEAPPKVEELREIAQAPLPAETSKSRTAPIRPESEKTLKCQECGSSNYPTEWYCEKCGSELATL